MVEANTLKLGNYIFPITHATIFRISKPTEERPSWEVEIRTERPQGVVEDSVDSYLYSRGVRFYSECDPIPIPNVHDLTGVELYLKTPLRPKIQ